MATAYKPPILTSIFRILGVLTLVLGAPAGLLLSTESATPGVELMLLSFIGCVIYFGMAQAVDYLARTAYSTDRLCTILETTIVERLRAIESNHSAPVAPAAATAPGKVGYYYSTDGTQQGPVDANDLKLMHRDGLVTDDTPVLREGDSEWRRFRDYVTLSR